MEQPELVQENSQNIHGAIQLYQFFVPWGGSQRKEGELSVSAQSLREKKRVREEEEEPVPTAQTIAPCNGTCNRRPLLSHSPAWMCVIRSRSCADVHLESPGHWTRKKPKEQKWKSSCLNWSVPSFYIHEFPDSSRHGTHSLTSPGKSCHYFAYKKNDKTCRAWQSINQ